MQHKCRVTVLEKKCFADYQEQYLADPHSGECPFYHVGDTFLFERYGDEDTFWLTGNGTQCGEAWDCISRYIYTALQGGSIMRNWTRDERIMIACCNDGTRPVIFKIERLDYKVVAAEGLEEGGRAEALRTALMQVKGVEEVQVRPEKGWIEVFTGLEEIPEDEDLAEAVRRQGFQVSRID